jgi:hypothetical protein
LAFLLSNNQEVYLPQIKETYFFCDDSIFSKGMEWLVREFYSTRAAERSRFWCDATPFYLASRTALERLASLAPPDARFLVTLRDPVSRAYSAYQHQRRLGYENLSFREALDAEPGRVQKAKAAGGRWWRHAYVEVGKYAEQLEAAFELLGRERILVLASDELDAVATLERIRHHIGLATPLVETDGERRNQAALPRSAALHRAVTRPSRLKTIARVILPRDVRSRIGRVALEANLRPIRAAPMEPEMRERLERAFAEELERLKALNVIDISTWRRAGDREVARTATDFRSESAPTE